jgi:predicted acylesterase/phospholipase RssA
MPAPHSDDCTHEPISSGGNANPVDSPDGSAAETLRSLSARFQDLCRNFALLDKAAIPRRDIPSALQAGAAEVEEFVTRGLQLSVLEIDSATNEVKLVGLLREYLRNSSRPRLELSLKEAEERAREVLGGMMLPPQELIKLAEILKNGRRVGLARRILDRWADKPQGTHNSDPALRLKFAQRRALCTYKDPDLSADMRLDRALGILEGADPLEMSENQETLGLAGAIHKRKWEATGIEAHLETSYAYYHRGYAIGVDKDYGYTAINAAFVLELLAANMEGGTRSAARQNEIAQRRREEAKTIRERIVTILPELAKDPNNSDLHNQWWFLVTLGEAYFGLGDDANARLWLGKAARLPDVPDWEWETTSRQLAALLRLRQKAGHNATGSGQNNSAEQTLREFLGSNFAAVTSVRRGKIGLALSGGGFRASLYHIGVLARLAELDLLRSVEYLSCVSGGSIVGAHYYLEVRHLLQERSDAEITREDYIRIVRDMADDFLHGVQRNIRTRIVAEWLTNLKMIFWPDYTRTNRAGELYESEIYARIEQRREKERRSREKSNSSANAARSPRKKNQELWLNELKIFPKDDPNFVPKDSNWRRSNKVPILVLNATTLNTGHNWQFTATWMGEPPAGADAEIDANYRLRRAYYDDLPDSHKRMRLGYAVAASACVPGLFDPLTLSDLYPDAGEPITVRLVDGGVHDNQGVAALLEQGCTVLLVSDASGQMDAQGTPSSSTLGVPLRANSILSARVRSAEYDHLEARRKSGLLSGLMFVHLKHSLSAASVDWKHCQDRSDPMREDPLLPYGIQRDVQRRVAAIRTDLDSFSEVEAFALMTSGYRMTASTLNADCLGFPVSDSGPLEPWNFLKIEPFMKEPGDDTPLMQLLKVSDKLALKVWMLPGPLRTAGIIIALALVVAALALSFKYSGTVLFELKLGTLGILGLGALVTAFGGGLMLKFINYRKTVGTILFHIALALVGWLVARLHLRIFDKRFLRLGKVSRLSKGAH